MAETQGSRTTFAKVALVVLALHLVGLGAPLLLEPDEGRYADVARELTHASSWVVPLADGLPFLDKPPLVAWLCALSIEALGPTALAVRLVPALCGVLAAAVAAWLAWQVHGSRKAAAWAALVYATSPLALGVGRTLVLDVPLTALMALGLALVWRGAGLFRAEASHTTAVLGGVVVGLASLVKGPVALGLTGLANALVLAANARTPGLRGRLLSPLPWIAAVLVAAPWFVLLARAEPDFFRVFIIDENFRRFGGVAVEHKHWIGFLAVTTLWGLGAWTLAWIAALWSEYTARGAGASSDSGRGRRALLIYATLVVGFFSLSNTKIETYVLPAFPALAAVIGGDVAHALERGRRRELGWVFTVVAAALALACVGGLLFALGAFPIPEKAVFARLARDGAIPVLALAPLPFIALAVRAARRGRPFDAALRLGLAVVAALPFATGAFAKASEIRSAAPVAEAIVSRKATLRNAKIAVFHYYYRGLPFYVDEPVVLLGEKGELKDEAVAARPGLWFPEGARIDAHWELRWTDEPVVDFLRSHRPLLVVVPTGNERPRRFREACERAGVKPQLLREQPYGDDFLFEVPE